MFKKWLGAARLRTLPLSLSGIILASFLAIAEDIFNKWIFIFAMLTTVGFQVISNFANDYGDGVKGTDNNERVGPERAVQSGDITPLQMKKAIIITSLITLFIALVLIYLSFGKENFGYSLLFFILGIASIAAAIKYTVGKSAYGYYGLGDVFVFLFFGLLSVCGTYFLYAKQIDSSIFLPAVSIGLLSAGVLNLNNMRDATSDIKSGKNTLVVKIGNKNAKYYHYFLLIGSFVFAVLFVGIHYHSAKQFLFILAYVPIFKHLITVYKNVDPSRLDPELKKLALSTLLFALLFGIGQIL
jgi:1,4-dihydroxy-2-naphthoate octaprenyltransferase